MDGAMGGDLITAAGTSVEVRRASAADEAFLHDLYADRRRPELAPLNWPEEANRAFIDMQFDAQQRGYGGAFPDADHWIVLVEREPVGRLLVDRRQDEHLVVDLVIVSGHRGRGIGTALMEAVLDDARRARLPVRLTAALSDPGVIAWYERLGFRTIDRSPLDARMVWDDSVD